MPPDLDQPAGGFGGGERAQADDDAQQHRRDCRILVRGGVEGDALQQGGAEAGSAVGLEKVRQQRRLRLPLLLAVGPDEQ